MNRILLSLFMVVLTQLSGFAAIEITSPAPLTGGGQLFPGAIQVLQDGQYPNLSSTAFTDQMATGWLELGVTELNTLYQGAAYTREVEVALTWYDNGGNSTNLTKSLTVEYDPYSSGTVEQNRHLFKIPNAYRLEVEVLSIKDENGLAVGAPSNLYFTGRIEVERYWNFNYLQVPSGITNTPLDLDGNSTAFEELQVQWPVFPGAELYELEWMHVDDYPASGTAAVPASSLPFTVDRFKYNATRISTKGNVYQIPLIYDRGYVIYRVRALAPGGLNFTEWQHSPWSTQFYTSASVVVDLSPGVPENCYYYHANAYEGSLNWQYSGAFAEEGKRKDLINFFDGSLHNRQSVSRINSTGLSLVGETFYDHQGRPAITTLPAPTGETALKFYPGFNQNQSGDPYSRTDFDLDQGTTCDVAADPMGTQSGASNYFSPQNPDKSGHQAYVPDAQGFPFTQVEYTDDNSGRIRRQGGAGSTHQLGTGRETKYFYDTPLQVQLDRLFGSDVGYAKHYQRVFMVDPNGQVSVEYKDMAGRTIATALAGDAPANVDALPNTPMVVDGGLLGKESPGDTDTGDDNNILVGQPRAWGLQYSATRAVPAEADYLFAYTAELAQFIDDCLLPTSACYDCVYDLEISLTDDCGNTPTGWNGYNATVGDMPGATNAGSSTCGAPVSIDVTTDLQVDAVNGVTLPQGDYKISKRLILNQEALNYYADAYLDDADPACVPQLQDFIDAAMADLDPADCYMDCQDCLDDLGPQGVFPGTAAEWQALYDECVEPCEPVTACKVGLEMMLGDMAPNGQYGEIEKDANNLWDATNFPLSIYNPTNQLPNGGTAPSWRNPFTDYLNEDGTVAYIEVLGSVAGNTTPQTLSSATLVPLTGNRTGVKPTELASLQEFVDNWEAHWAKQLIQFHPEYCYYSSCAAYEDIIVTVQGPVDISSAQFDQALMLATTAADAANLHINGQPTGVNLITNPWEIIFLDPYFNVTTNLTTPAEYQEMGDLLSTTGDYQNSGYNMYAFAALGARCGNYYATAGLPAGCTDYGTGTDPAVLDAEWNAFKNFYLSYKQQMQQARDRANAIAGDCYNGCIGVDVFVPAAAPDFYTGTNPGWSDPANNPCASANYWLFATKEPRFPSTELATAIPPTSNVSQLDPNDHSSLANVAGYNQFLATGECPMAVQLKALLSGINGSGMLTANAMPLFNATNSSANFPEFTPALYDEVTTIANGSPPPATTFVEYEWTGTVSSVNGGTSNRLVIDLLEPTTTYNVSNLVTLTFNQGSTNNFAFSGNYSINSFGKLEFLYEQSGVYYFTLKVSLTNNGVVTTETLYGETVLPVGNCDFDPICEPGAYALDVQLLMNSLLAQGTMTTAQDLAVAPFDVLFANTLLAQVGPASGTYNWTYGGANSFTITDNGGGPNGIALNFASNPGFANVDYLISLKPNPDYPGTSSNNGIAVFRMNNNTTQTVEVYVGTTISGVNNSAILLGDCDDPTPMECQGEEIQMAADLAALFDALVDDNALARNDLAGNLNGSPVPLSGTPHFTTRMQATLGGGNYEWGNIVILGGTLTANLQPAAGNPNTHSCQFTLDFVESNPTFGFADIESFEGFTVLTDNPQGGSYYDFQIVAYRMQGNVLQMEVLEGSTSCFAIENCAACLSQTGLEGTAYSERIVGGNFFNQTSSSNHVYLTYTAGCPANGEYTFTQDASASCGNSPAYLGTPRQGTATPDYFLMTGAVSGATADQLVWSQAVINLLPKTDYVFQARYSAIHYDPSYTGTYEVYLIVNNTEVARETIDPFDLNAWNRIAGNWRSGLGSTATLSLYLATGNSGSFPPMGFDDLSMQKGFLCEEIEPVFLPDPVPAEDPCEAWQTALAMANATQNYDEAMKEFIADFKREYADQCLAKVVENFDLTFEDLEYHHTLFYYDRAGNLVQTVPPAGVLMVTNPADLAQIKSDRNAGVRNFTTGHTMATTYRYNSLNQLVEQSMPDHLGATRFWYDDLGRIVASQNAKQAANSTPGNHIYSYTRYDGLGRTIEAGEMLLSGTFDTYTVASYGAPNYPDNMAQVPRYEVTKTYYDAPLLANNGIAQFGGDGQQYLFDRVAAVAYFETYDFTITTAQHDHATHYNYDVHGNVKQLVQDDPNVPFADQQYKLLEYNYDLVSGNVNQVSYQDGEADGFHHRFDYDADNRVTAVETSDNGVVWDEDARYQYYQHGSMARTELGQDKVQGNDYMHTIHGWMKGMNSEALSPNSDPGKDGQTITPASFTARDVVGYSLGFYEGDYNPIATLSGTARPQGSKTTSGLLAGTNDLYNGNIARMVTSIAPLGAPQAMGYQYDQLQRLKKAERYDDYVASTNTWVAGTADLDYKVELTYDGNGNIMTLKRNGTTANGNPLAMDDLDYVYTSGTNQLDHVKDEGSYSGNYSSDIDDQTPFTFDGDGNYGYDEIGQLFKDEAEEIENIVWTVTGKVKEVQRFSFSTKPDLKFRYDAMGNRIAKTVIPKDGSGVALPTNEWTTTYYVRDAQGQIMATYQHEYADHGSQGAGYYNEHYNLSEQHLYGSNRLGVKSGGDYARLEHVEYTAGAGGTPILIQQPSPTDYFRKVGRKGYELSNHLGNVLAVISDRKLLEDGGTYDANGILTSTALDGANDYAVADVQSYSDYYPFGMLMPERNGNSGDFQFGFNGMERDDELKGGGNSYDFGARLYDSRLGRWLSIDPLSGNYPSNSPFGFVGNSPIMNTEVDGRYYVFAVTYSGHWDEFQAMLSNIYGPGFEIGHQETKFKDGREAYRLTITVVDESKITDKQRMLYEAFMDKMNNPSKVVEIELIRADDNEGGGPKVWGDGFDRKAIDTDDLKQRLGSQGRNGISLIGHYFSEQWDLQIGGEENFMTNHSKAWEFEYSVLGFFEYEVSFDSEKGIKYFNLIDVDGQYKGTVLYYLERNRVIDETGKEVPKYSWYEKEYVNNIIKVEFEDNKEKYGHLKANMGEIDSKVFQHLKNVFNKK